jgi:hypothetical protein
MKISLQYVSDVNGTPQAVQIPVSEWEKMVSYIKKTEQQLKLKTEITLALHQAEVLKKSKRHKQTLTEFLHEL